MMETKFNTGLRTKDVDTTRRTIVQAFTRYNVVDHDGDIGCKGMFQNSWNTKFSRIKHLLNHDPNRPLGKIEKMWEDDSYAYMKSRIGNHALGEDFLKMAESGLITEASYGFRGAKRQRTPGGKKLLEVDLWEISSLTAWGANQFSPLLSIDEAKSRLKALEGFCGRSRISEETGQMLELEMKSLRTFVSGTPATGSSLSPDSVQRILAEIQRQTNRMKNDPWLLL
jgi:HK97 family phage prohead protease